jgi:hypothetical protein
MLWYIKFSTTHFNTFQENKILCSHVVSSLVCFHVNAKRDDKDETAAAADCVLVGRGYYNKLQALKMHKNI